MTSARVALRIAWRDALRAKGRTALIMCMVGLPVAAIVALGTVWQTSEWSPREALPYELGTADARLTGDMHAPLRQNPLHPDFVALDGATDPAEDENWTTAEITRRVTAAYGADARVVPIDTTSMTWLRTPRGYLRADLVQVDLRDPLARGILDVAAGRAPAAADEIALAAGLADRFPIGSAVQLDRDGTAKRVVGHVRDPRSPGRRVALALPGTVPGAARDAGAEWLIDTGRPVTWKDVTEFNRDGVTVLSRAVVEDPPPASALPPGVSVGSGLDDPAAVSTAALAGAMILLEVVLLAGPAFAVDVRRRRRLLALLAVTGGGPRHLRAVVLAGGLVLGGAGALAGTLLGLAATAAARTIVHGTGGTVWGPFEVPWAAVALTALLGAVSGLIAAYVPARQAARMDVVAALAGRRDPGGGRVRRGRPIAGGVLVWAGALGSLVGEQSFGEFGAAFGAVAIILGGVLLIPWLVGATGRAAGRLPVPLRLAVRDGARNRARTAPAVAAIMAAVAGATALALANASDLRQERMEYTPLVPVGSTLITPPQEQGDAVRAAVERELPGVPLIELRTLPDDNSVCPGDADCPSVSFRTDPYPGEVTLAMGSVVGGAAEARMLLGRADPRVEAALAAGEIVLFGVRPPPDATTTATVSVWRDGREAVLEKVRDLPAIAVAERAPVEALVPPAAAERIGVPPRTTAFGIDRAHHPVTEAEQARLAEVVAGLSRGDANIVETGNVRVERGFNRSNDPVMLALAAAAAVLALGGALIATGLSAADARPDLAVLAAVGARPRTRRLLSACQAAYIAALGCWLGLAAGLVPGIAASRSLTDGGTAHGPVLAVPWTLLAVLGIAIPLLVALVTGLCVRSKLPKTHVTAD
ncbi:FtsX-like permease family protein [Actinomadura algeriensis]|uniref:ABC transport system permease protein n=1 Tax=Actinomadura algeriensis TaxID=1679523 RepID=A0ABR9JVS1_9ACTN|nr:FtsX-like permease family protein [Actinomadura algeriensis]MBE1534655.1 putative ABC transport system permease protein [Actinomadura algeriensis]